MKVIVEDWQRQQEIARHKSSIVLYDLNEPIGDSIKREDSERIQDLLHKLESDTVAVNLCIRLGKLSEDLAGKPRPVKFVLALEGKTDRIL